MGKNRPKNEGANDPEILLLPLERRPWTGSEEEARWIPQRLIERLYWLSEEESEIVCRHTWDDCSDLLVEDGYLALRGLETQLAERLERQQAERERFGELVREVDTDRSQLQRAAKRFGAESSVAEAAGKEGWKRPEIKLGNSGSLSAVVWASDEHNEGRTRPLSVKIGSTWKKELQEKEEEMAEVEARATSVWNQLLVVAFRHSVCSEVLRHYEVYGLSWKWDEPEVSESLRIDPTEGQSGNPAFIAARLPDETVQKIIALYEVFLNEDPVGYRPESGQVSEAMKFAIVDELLEEHEIVVSESTVGKYIREYLKSKGG